MTDASDVTVPNNLPAGGIDNVSKETYDHVKTQLAELTAKNAELSAAAELWNGQQRDVYAKMQATIVEGLAANKKDLPESLQTGALTQTGALESWAANIHQMPVTELHKPFTQELVGHVYAFSAKAKRAHDAEAAMAEKETAYRDAVKKNDELIDENKKLQKRVDEMASLAQERQAAVEEVSQRYAGIIGQANRYNFSQRTSREASYQTPADKTINEPTTTNASDEVGAPTNTPTGAAPLVTLTDNQTGKRPMAYVDPISSLQAMIMREGGQGSSRIARAQSSHSWLGGTGEPGATSSSGAPSAELVAAIAATR